MKRILLCLWAFLVAGSLCQAEVDWPQLQFSLLTSELASPVHIANGGDGSGRIYIVEQQGTVRVLHGTNLEPALFLDIRANVLLSGAERGLLSIAFPPAFETSRHFYVYYTRKPDGVLTLSRFSLLPDQESVNTNSEQVLITELHPNNNHNGGQMAFGPDGYLYLSIGDGAYGNIPSNPAQRLDSLLGKILRIDSENGNPYAIPPTNPFVTNAAARPEIWAYGLRNPWRFSFDRNTGDLYIADVGQTEREEINFQPAGSAGGQNYGWPKYEGDRFNSTNFPSVPTNSLTYPVAVYSDPFNSSIIGGYVYRQTNFARFAGVYFYGDFMQQRIYGMKFDEGQWKSALLGTFPRMSAFGEDEEGQLYLLDYYGGKIHLVKDNGTAARPTFNPPSGNSPSEFITINSLTANSTIRYTFENRYPTELDSGVAPGAFVLITNGTSIRAQTFRGDLMPSLVSTGTFNFVVGMPRFNDFATNLNSASILSNTVMTITSATPSVQIYYTTNNTVPTTNSTFYTGPFILNPSRLYARAFRTGFVDSGRMMTFISTNVAPLVFSPAVGPITNGTLITISCATLDAVIFYTLDGTNPTTDSIPYTGTFSIPGNTTVKATAFKSNYVTSFKTVYYSLPTVATPVFVPGQGPITNGTSLTMTSATLGAAIYFTLDGSEPTNSSTLYSVPVLLYGNVQVRARAFKTEYNISAIQDVSYELPRLNAVSFYPSSGPITNGTLIQIIAAEPDVNIFYTLDGIVPTTNSTSYGTAISLSGNVWLSAKSFKEGYNDSDVVSTFFTLIIPDKTVVTTIAGTGTAGYRDDFGVKAEFNSPYSICHDGQGVVYVADSFNFRIRKISTLSQVSTFAGSGVQDSIDGSGVNASFTVLSGLTIGSNGNIYASEGGNRTSRVRKISRNGGVTTLLDFGEYEPLWKIAIDPNDNLYVGKGRRVLKLPSNGGASWSDYLGIYGNLGICLDLSNNVIVASGSGVMRLDSVANISIIAGINHGFSREGFSDGDSALALFSFANDAAVDALGNIYVTDAGRIRRISTNGIVHTVAGTGLNGYVNGPGNLAQFKSPAGLCLDVYGNIYVADTGNHCIRRISADVDSDEIPDFEEIAGSGFVVGVDDRSVDSDGDGQSNVEEYIAGTNPLSSTSSFQIKKANLIGNNFIVSWEGIANRIYELSSSSNFTSWSVVTNMPVGMAGETSLVISNGAASLSQTFYRLRVSLP